VLIAFDLIELDGEDLRRSPTQAQAGKASTYLHEGVPVAIELPAKAVLEIVETGEG
jgi:ATP-dependent DNA ligase